MKRYKSTHTLRELRKLQETASVLNENLNGKEIREFLEKHKLCADRNTVHRLKKGVKEVSCGDFIFIEDFLCFVNKSKAIKKRWKRGQRANSSGEVTGRKPLQESLVGVPQSRAIVALSINSVFSLDAATTFLTSSSKGVAMSIVC